MTNFRQIINRLTGRSGTQRRNFGSFGVFGSFDGITNLNYSGAIWINAVKLLTVICNDVKLTNKTTDRSKIGLFSDFKIFFELHGSKVLNLYFSQGLIIIGHSGGRGFRILRQSEYVTKSLPNGDITYSAVDTRESIYIIASDTYAEEGQSDKALLRGWLDYIDNTVNASNTVTTRLGSAVFASPKNEEKLNITTLSKAEAQEMEREISEGYGALSRQKQFVLFRQPMEFTSINLASADLKVQEKIRGAVCVIADRIQVPANQIALIDAVGSKSLANGSEYMAGDFAKYQSFERLLQATFIRLANEVGLRVDYTIYNKPEMKTEDNHLM